MEPKKRIFDNRKKDKFQVDDEYLNGYAKLCGWKATLSYISLCRHANRDQYCFPKIEDMAKQHHVSRKIIIEGVKILEDWNIIQVIKKRRNDGAFRNNAYILLDKSEWKPKPPSENNDQVSNGDMDDEDDQVPNSDSDEEQPTSPIDTPPSNPQEPHQVSNGDCKETHGKESHSKEVISNDITPEASDENKSYGREDINQCMEYFKEQLGGRLDESVKTNRQYCFLLLNGLKRDYPEHDTVAQVKFLISRGLQDNFHKRNLTSFKYLFNNRQKIIQSIKSNKDKTPQSKRHLHINDPDI